MHKYDRYFIANKRSTSPALTLQAGWLSLEEVIYQAYLDEVINLVEYMDYHYAEKEIWS